MPRKALTIDLAGSGIRFLRINADQSTDELTSAQMLAALGGDPLNVTRTVVASQAARYALTTATVQNGDYVYQTDTAMLYEVTDDTQLGNASGYTALATVTAAQISDSTTAGRALLTAADVGAQRSTLGLGTLATQNGTFSGTHSGTSSGNNTGDQTITLTGDVTGSGTGSFVATLAANAVTLAKFQQLAAMTMVGNVTAGTANGTALTATQVNMVGDASYTTTVSSVSNITLTVASTTKQRFTGSAAQPLTLPVTSTLNLGHRFTVINDGSAAITVKSSGANTIATIAAGQTGIFTCVLTNGTTGASWSYSVAQSAHAALIGLTGIGSSWTPGGLLYASGTTTLALLPGVAVNQVLVSGGVGANPAWSGTPRVASLYVITGLSVEGGGTNTVSGGAASVGTSCTANQLGAVANGYYCTASAVGAFAHGSTAVAREYGFHAFSTGYNLIIGGNQLVRYTLAGQTTNDTVQSLTRYDGGQYTLPDPLGAGQGVFFFEVKAAAISSSGARFCWHRRVIVDFSGVLSNTAISADYGGPGPVLSFDYTSGAGYPAGLFRVRVTGVSGETINWSVAVEVLECATSSIPD